MLCNIGKVSLVHRENKRTIGLFERFISFSVTKKRKKYECSCQISGLIKLTLQLSRVGMSLMFTGHEVTSVRNSLVRHFCPSSETMSFL